MILENISEENCRDTNEVFFILCDLPTFYTIRLSSETFDEVQFELHAKYELFDDDHIKMKYSR
jgi:hypothetical protein